MGAKENAAATAAAAAAAALERPRRSTAQPVSYVDASKVAQTPGWLKHSVRLATARHHAGKEC